MSLRIVFMGTPDIACATLQALATAPDCDVVGVVAQPDKPRGRDLKLQPPPVKELALRLGVPVLQPTRARDRAAFMVPKLAYDSLDEWGFDVSLVYPTIGFLLLKLIEDRDQRQVVVRAFNVMTADMFGPYLDRVIPAAIISLDTPAEALEQLDPLWDELFPAEQARIVRLLVERVEVSPAGADIRLRLDGLASLVRDLRASPVRQAA